MPRQNCLLASVLASATKVFVTECGMSNTHSLILAGLLLASSGPAFADITGVQAGTSGGVHGDVQIAKADYTPSQRQIGHQIGSGEPIYMGDQIATGTGGGLQVMLLDQTVMTLGQNAKMTVDEMVYDPKSGTGKLNFNVSQGAFRFVSGQIAKANPENVKITTPMATIGIRGTIVGGAVDGNNAVIALLGPGGETNTSARHGAIEVTTPNGTVSISRTGFATTITPGQPPSPPTPATPAQLQQFGQAGAGSNGTAAPSTASSGTTSSGGSTEPQSSASPSQTPAAASPTENSASAVTGQGLASGGAISSTMMAFVAQQAQNSIIAQDVQTSSQINQVSSLGTVSLSDLVGKSTTFNSSELTVRYNAGYYEPYVESVDGNISNSITANSLTNWTVSTTSGATYTQSDWTTDTSGYWPSGAKTSSASRSDGTQYATIYDMASAADLSYMHFGTYFSRDTSYSADSMVACLASSGCSSNASLGVYAFGVVTPVSSMPSTGSASYSGSTTGYGQFYYNTNEHFEIYAYKASVSLSANFSSKAITGTVSSPTFTNLYVAGTCSSGCTPWSQIALSGTLGSGSAANTYSGSVTGITNTASTTGSIDSSSFSGKFYGTKYAEVGGTYSAAYANGSRGGNYVTGSYGAAKQ